MTATQVIADRYEVLSELGSGGFAVVYKVRDRMLNKEFALKMLKNEQASGEHLMRFQQEAMLVSKLNHPSISTVFHCGLTDGNQPFLVMDFHDGKTLLEIIESDGPYDIQSAIDIFVQICDGMAYSHEQQAIIHRDLKTANMMIVTEGGVPNRVKILDFGLGKMTSSSAGVLTRPGMALGSPAYMSPEHAHGKQLDERSDIYSLGCIMFETLTGAAPIRGHSQVDTIIKQISQAAPPMATVAKGKIKEFPPQLEKIVAKALEKEPAKRFQSMRELKEALLAVNLSEKKEPQLVAATMAKPVLFAIGAVILGLVGWGTYVAFFAPIESAHDVKATREPPKKSSDAKKKSDVVAEVVGRLGTEGGVPGEVGPDAGGGTANGGMTNPDEEPGMRIIEGGSAHAKTPVEGVMASGMFWEKLMSDEWNEWPWEGGVIWKKKFGVSEADLIKASKVPSFGNVSLYSEGHITEKGLRAICAAPITGIGVGNSNVNTKLMEIIGTASSLEVLYLDQNEHLTDRDLKPIARLKKLRFLSMTKDSFTDDALATVSQLRSLRALRLDHMPNVRGKGLAYLASLPNLDALLLEQVSLDEKGWKELAKLKSIKRLSLGRTSLTDARLATLMDMPLEMLDVSDTVITERGLELLHSKRLTMLHAAKCPNLSKSELQRFEANHPKCTVDTQWWGQLHQDPLIPRLVDTPVVGGEPASKDGGAAVKDGGAAAKDGGAAAKDGGAAAKDGGAAAKDGGAAAKDAKDGGAAKDAKEPAPRAEELF